MIVVLRAGEELARRYLTQAMRSEHVVIGVRAALVETTDLLHSAWILNGTWAWEVTKVLVRPEMHSLRMPALWPVS